MQHVNVCDLSVFPCMIKRYTQLTRENYGMHVLNENQIWQAAEHVFKELPSCKISSGFIQAYRLCAKIIEHGGDNTFLSGSSGGIRTGVSVDFYPTDKGLARKDGRVYPKPKQFTYHDEAAVIEDGEVRLKGMVEGWMMCRRWFLRMK